MLLLVRARAGFLVVGFWAGFAPKRVVLAHADRDGLLTWVVGVRCLLAHEEALNMVSNTSIRLHARSGLGLLTLGTDVVLQARHWHGHVAVLHFHLVIVLHLI